MINRDMNARRSVYWSPVSLGMFVGRVSGAGPFLWSKPHEERAAEHTHKHPSQHLDFPYN